MRKGRSKPDGIRIVHSSNGQCGKCKYPYIPSTEPTTKAAQAVRSKTNRRLRYGLSDEKYLELLSSQGNRCATCPTDASTLSKDLYVDHDHSCCPGRGSCGKCVRGLLCSRCNFALGQVDDSIDVLTSMIQYLTNHQEASK